MPTTLVPVSQAEMSERVAEAMALGRCLGVDGCKGSIDLAHNQALECLTRAQGHPMADVRDYLLSQVEMHIRRAQGFIDGATGNREEL